MTGFAPRSRQVEPTAAAAAEWSGPAPSAQGFADLKSRFAADRARHPGLDRLTLAAAARRAVQARANVELAADACHGRAGARGGPLHGPRSRGHAGPGPLESGRVARATRS